MLYTIKDMIVQCEYCRMLPFMARLLIMSMVTAPALSVDVCGIDLPRAGRVRGICYYFGTVTEEDFEFVEVPYKVCSCYSLSVTAQGLEFSGKLAKRAPGFRLCDNPHVAIQKSTNVTALVLPGCQTNATTDFYLPLRTAGKLSPGTEIDRMCIDYDSFNVTVFEELNRRVTGDPSLCSTTTPGMRTTPSNSGCAFGPMIGLFIGLITLPIILTK